MYFIVHRYDDIALIHLSTPAQLNDRVNTLCMPDAQETFGSYSLCYTAGWGYTYRHRMEFGTILNDKCL